MRQVREVSVAVVGGGPAGLAAAAALGGQGIDVVVCEAGQGLGGAAAEYGCKAVGGVCVGCGACVVGDLVEQVMELGVGVELGARVIGARRQGRGWVLKVEGRGEISARVVVLAIGQQPFDPRRASRFGYGRVDGVVSGLELEARVRQGWKGAVPRSVGFIQCVGSRDTRLGRGWCSRACCGYGLRLARWMARELGSKAKVFFMDIQDYGPGWREELEEIRRDVELVRAMVGGVSRGEKGVVVHYEPAGGRPVSEELEMVVLSVGMGPPRAARAMAEAFGLALTPEGFVGKVLGGIETGAGGVVVAGAAAGPMTIPEAIDHGRWAAAAAVEQLAVGAEVANG